MIVLMQTDLPDPVAPDAAGGLMLSFLSLIVQGLLCGIFFPASMLPAGLGGLGELLPGGAAVNYLAKFMLYGPEIADFLPVFGWLVVFFAISALIRATRKGRGE